LLKMLGICKWFDAKKGFGFVTSEEHGMDYFVHQSNIMANGFRKLEKDQCVAYEIQEGTKGRQNAVRVRIVSDGIVETPV
jgi:CspA family cold shock protein